MSEARRKKRCEIKVLSTESTWLQKTLFALDKAETSREKWAERWCGEGRPTQAGETGGSSRAPPGFMAMASLHGPPIRSSLRL